MKLLKLSRQYHVDIKGKIKLTIDLPVRILVHHVQEVVRVEVPPFVHGLGEDVHVLTEPAEVLEVGALPRPDISLHENCEGPGGDGDGGLDERQAGTGSCERSFLYHRQNLGDGLGEFVTHSERSNQTC